MTNQDEWAFDEIGLVIRACCGAMFGPPMDPSVRASPAPDADLRPPSSELFSYIEFEGPGVRGMLVLRQPKRASLATHPRPAPPEHSDADAVDWASERVNQVAGRMANRLSAKGVSIQIGLPATLHGRAPHPVCDCDPPARFGLVYEGESAWVYLCARVHDWSSAPDDMYVERSTSEGAILLF
jgi:hypothetical protein